MDNHRFGKFYAICQCLAAAAMMLWAPAGPASAQTAAPPGAQETAIPNLWDPRLRAQRQGDAIEAIRFVTSDDYPPFNFLDAQGRLTGFNIDLTRAICRELEVSCTVQARPWDDIAAAVTEGRADAAIAGLAITPESRERLAFSDVYLRSPGRFVVRRQGGPAISATGLAGRTVAVAEGTAHQAYLADFFPSAESRAYDGAEAARAALKAGEAAALFGDGIQLSFWLQSDQAEGCCRFAGGPYAESHYFGLGFAIAVAPDNERLRLALNTALQAVHASGTYAELYLRYFPVGFF